MTSTVYRKKSRPEQMIQVSGAFGDARATPGAEDVAFSESGGPVRRMPRAELERDWEAAPAHVFRLAATTGDLLRHGDKQTYLRCYSDGRRFSTGMPYFQREEIEQMMALGIGPLEWDGDKVVAKMTDDAELSVQNSAEHNEVYEPVTLPDGVVVWTVGAGSWSWAPCTVVPTMDETLERMKREVHADIKAGRVPAGVRRFTDLEQHVDPNGYGGFYEADLADALAAAFGGRAANGDMPQGMVEYISVAHLLLDAWLRSEGHLVDAAAPASHALPT